MVIWLAMSFDHINAQEFNEAILGDYQKINTGAVRTNINDNVNESIDPFTGILQRHYVDLEMPGNGGLDIKVHRVYTKKQSEDLIEDNMLGRTSVGLGWDIHFGRILTNAFLNHSNSPSSCRKNYVHFGYNPVLQTPEGGRSVLLNSNSSEYAYKTKGQWIAKCLPSNHSRKDGGLIVYSPDGLEYLFDIYGRLPGGKNVYYVSKISDTKGNFLTLNYKKKSQNNYIYLNSIKSNDGRSLTFSYDELLTLKQVSTNDGRTVQYNHEEVPSFINGRPEKFIPKEKKPFFLTSVKRPDGKLWQYQYDTNRGPNGDLRNGNYRSLTKVISPLGLETTYKYNIQRMSFWDTPSSHVVSGKTLKVPGIGSQTWSYTYQQDFDQPDETWVKGPDYCEHYTHVGQKMISRGPLGVNRGLWKVGNLQKKVLYTKNGNNCAQTPLREEEYIWDKLLISEQNEVRGNSLRDIVDTETYAPILAKKVIRQDGQEYTTNYSDYDQYGNAQTVVEKGQGTRTYKYTYHKPANHWMVHLVSSENINNLSKTNYTYNAQGLPTQINKNGVVTKYTYNNGNIASITDANGKVSYLQDYYRGVPRKEIRPGGTSIARTVNATGTVASETNERGYTAYFNYDPMNRLVKVTPPKGQPGQVTIGYHYEGNGLTKTVRRGDLTQSIHFNALGLPYKTLQAGGGKTISQVTKYDILGRKTAISYPAYGHNPAKYISLGYDPLGRITRKQFPDSSVETYTYQGNTLQVKDAKGRVAKTTYVGYGDPEQKEISRIDAPEGMSTVISRNPLGMVTAVSQGGITREFKYNAKLMLDQEINPELGVTQYYYDNVGNVTSKRVGTGGTYRYQYDNLYRLTGLYYPANSSGTPDVHYQYDALGNITQVNNEQVTWQYTYDAHNNLIKEIATLKAKSASANYTIQYAYNANDVLTQVTYPSGHVIGLAPNALGQATTVGHYASQIAYHSNGQLASLRYGNGQILTVSQEANRQRLNRIQVNGANNVVDLAYQYDVVGNVVKIADGIYGFNNRTLGYDGLNRLVNAQGKWGSAQYSYNSRNDITRKVLGNKSYNYGYDGQGRLQQVTGSQSYQFSYNGVGSVTSNGSLTFGYDGSGLNVARACYTANNNCQTDPDFFFRYDGHNRRVATLNKSGNTYYTLYNKSGQLLYEEDAVSGDVTEYFYLAGQQIAKRQTCSDTDTDQDKLPDCIEKHWGYDANNSADGLADNDGDGISNGEEYHLKTNPELADSDGDGISDSDEIKYGFDPLVKDADKDLDQDGLTNLQELELGTDPTDADTDNDGLPDGSDPQPTFNVAVLIPILHNLLY
ncbi:hypothetical protein KCM76_11825 [Zooshikella marina]|uniref:hypothetical protein n=1 Tax=Zooshikella ganghwensis TaxID=202772 RepID=UPI001BB0ABA0|nr:hypothetical protein [Zooshikella ganghwensis]MBU2706673.1 hypothetical protein [Zooshikella ganghwensis]